MPKQISVKAMSPLCHVPVSKWVPPVWTPSKETEHCVRCHGPDTVALKARKWNQQGHMECLMCHDDRTA